MLDEIILNEVLAELKRSKKKHPSFPIHIVARAGIVCEEAGELIRAALIYKYETPIDKVNEEQWKKEMEKEAIHVCATAIRFIESLRK
jgi:NTP pyrophosphatase (non-canonical NTP hydrolase)